MPCRAATRFVALQPCRLATVSHCVATISQCVATVLHCVATVLHCVATVLHWLRCNRVALQCNRTVLRCNHVAMQCNRVVPRCSCVATALQPRCNRVATGWRCSRRTRSRRAYSSSTDRSEVLRVLTQRTRSAQSTPFSVDASVARTSRHRLHARARTDARAHNDA